VALYEALYDERPFEGASFAELRARVLSGGPPVPSNARDVPAWILRVILRGLLRDPAARHGSMDELLEALDRDPGRRRRRAAAWSMAALAVVGAGWAYRAQVERELARAREAGDPCGGASDRLAGIWDDARKQEIHRAFSDTKLEYAAGTWERMEARIDDWAARWVTAQQAICRATRVEHVQSDALLDVRQACLNSRLSELRAHAAVFARADGRAIEGAIESAIESVEALRDPDECRAVESMRVELPLPDDEAEAARAVELRQRLHDVAALVHAVQDAEALAQAEATVVAAEALGYLPVVAEAQLALGRVYVHHGRFDAAVAALDRALWAAEVGRHDAAAVDVWSEWVRTVGYSQHRPERARVMLPRLDAALHRLGRDVRREATVQRVLGTLAFAEDDFTAAVERYEAALALLEGEPAPDRGEISRACQNLGTALYRVGRLDESAAVLDRALVLSEALYGPQHPRLAPVHQSLGGLARRRGDRVAAQRHYAQTVEILETSHPTSHPALSTNYRNLGDAFMDEGDHEQAIVWYRKALDTDRHRMGDAGPSYISSLVLGHALLEVGRPREALEHLEHGVAHADDAEAPARVATGRFDLARVLWDADPSARARAVELATKAREHWAVHGRAPARERVEAWLASHRVP
jgi:tetratricopeptide (TPR) repeat protein